MQPTRVPLLLFCLVASLCSPSLHALAPLSSSKDLDETDASAVAEWEQAKFYNTRKTLWRREQETAYVAMDDFGWSEGGVLYTLSVSSCAALVVTRDDSPEAFLGHFSPSSVLRYGDLAQILPRSEPSQAPPLWSAKPVVFAVGMDLLKEKIRRLGGSWTARVFGVSDHPLFKPNILKVLETVLRNVGVGTIHWDTLEGDLALAGVAVLERGDPHSSAPRPIRYAFLSEFGAPSRENDTAFSA